MNKPTKGLTILIPQEILEAKEALQGMPSYNRVLEYADVLERNIYIADIDDSIIDTAAYHIRKWNKDDEREGIAIEDRTPIKLFINSDGGHLHPTMNVIDMIKLSKTPVWTIGQSRCYSSGGLLLLAGHRRIVHSHTSFLLHSGSTGAMGTTDKVFDNIEFQRKFEDRVKDFVLEKSKITEEEYDKQYRRDWFMDIDDIMKYGIADEIATEII